jgi:hypothetical protein
MTAEPLAPLSSQSAEPLNAWLGIGVGLAILVLLLASYFILLAVNQRRIRRRVGFERPLGPTDFKRVA